MIFAQLVKIFSLYLWNPNSITMLILNRYFIYRLISWTESFWEANRFSASQEIPRILRSPKVHWLIHQSAAPVPILSQINQFYGPQIHFLKIHFNNALPSKSGSSKWLLSPIYIYPLKVKCTLVRALTLCTGRTARRGSRGIALLFLDHGIRRGWGVSVTPRPLFAPGKDPIPIVQEAEWAQGPVWTGTENLAPTGIRSLDRPARSQSLYQLSYPARHI